MQFQQEKGKRVESGQEKMQLQQETLRAQEEALLARQSALQAQQEKEHIEHLRQEQEYRTLKAQLQPHFLFNTLNLIASEIEYSPTNAVTLLEELSELLRNVLNASSKAWVYLEQEVKLITLYLSIQKKRFGDLLEYHIEVPDNCANYRVPPLILQPFVENAVVHGIYKSGEAGCVHISVKKNSEHLSLTIQDDGEGFDVESASRGYGLSIIEETLQLLYKNNQRLSIESVLNKGTSVLIEIPLEEV